MDRKKVALVLSGGAALGLTHIGVIKALEKYKVPIDIVVGTSMGALVGSAYCSGLSVKEMTDFACKFNKSNFFDVNFNMSGIFSGKGVMRSINKFLPDKNIEDFKRTFACVSCELYSQQEVVFTSGNVREAVRASLSIPGIFVPVEKDDKLYVDGGMINNLPEDVAVKLGADIIISVDVLSNYKISKKPRNIMDTLVYSMNVMIKEIQKRKKKYSDVLIQPEITGLNQLSFGKANTQTFIKIGAKETEKHIEQILKLIK